MKYEILNLLEANPLKTFSRSEIISRFGSSASKHISSLLKENKITCILPGRYPKYIQNRYDNSFRVDLENQQESIRARIMMLGINGTYSFESRQSLVDVFSEIDEGGWPLYNKSVVGFIVDKLVTENKIKICKNGTYKIMLSAIPIKLSHISNSEAFTSIDRKMTFGVELEFISRIKPHVISHILKDAGFNSINEDENFKKRHEFWFVCEDGSVDTGKIFKHDVEISTPVLIGKKGISELYNFFRVIKTLEKAYLIKTHQSAGLHVHHGVLPGLDIRKLINHFIHAQPAMNALFPVHRACIDSYNYQAVKSSYFYKNGRINYKHMRCMNLNINPVKTIGTVEFRQHHATFSFSHTCAWILFGQKFIKESQVEPCDYEINKVSDLFKMIKLSSKVKKIYSRKIYKDPVFV